MQATDFLNVFLKAGTRREWVKPEQVIHHVHRESNHSADVLKNIPIEVQRHLTLLSSNNAMFEAAKAQLQDALVRAGYDHQLVSWLLCVTFTSFPVCKDISSVR